MQYKIYQLNKDNSDKLFLPLEALTNKVSIRNYSMVYQGDVKDLKEADLTNVYSILNEIYYKFNIEPPMDFYGWALSVSDIVEINGNRYYVDSINFKRI